MKARFIFLFIILLSSCTDHCVKTQEEVSQIMKAWYKKKIKFPHEIEVLDAYHQVGEKKVVDKFKKYTIVHFFTADCEKCVNDLSKIKTAIHNNTDSGEFNFVFIASAPTKKYVVDAIEKTKFPYNVLYEKIYYSFKTMNNFPLTDEVYDTMILNSKNEVLLFGAFYDNDKAKKLYSEIVKCGL